MQFRMLSLLLHSDAVPVAARNALKAAEFGPPHLRCAELSSAAQVLHQEAGLACSDVRELLDLPQCSGF